MWFRDAKLVDAYKSIVADQEKRGYLLDRCDKGCWYVTLFQTLSELRDDRGGVICLFKVRRRGLFGHRIAGERVCKANLVYHDERGEMVLGDIESGPEDRGYGSAVIKSMIKICRQLGVKLIRGEISERDSGHLDKLRYFYAKHNFEVTMYKMSSS